MQWASVDGPVYCRPYVGLSDKVDVTLYVHVIEAAVTPAGSHDMGQVSGGSLALSFRWLLIGTPCNAQEANSEVPLQPYEESFRISFSDGDQFITAQKDSSDDDDGDMVYVLPTLLVTEDGYIGHHTTATTRRHSEHEDALIDGQEPRRKTLAGLLLRPTGTLNGQYRRVGSFRVEYSWDTDKERFENFIRALPASERSTAESGCAEIIDNPNCPDERYVINIV
jgi:hypothetical protein